MSSQAAGRRVEVHPGKEAIVQFDPDRTFTCVDRCTWCCHHGVMLYEPDVFELAEHASLAETTTEARGETFVRRQETARDEHVGVDGSACMFLDGNGMCSMQAEHDWKPTRCSVFPLSVSLENDEIVVDVRVDADRNCEGLDESDRRLIDNLDAFLPPVLWDLDEPDTGVRI